MPVSLHGLVILTGLGCTLRCRDCGNHMPYIPPARRRPIELSALAEDVKLLSGRLACDVVQRISSSAWAPSSHRIGSSVHAATATAGSASG